MQVTATHMVDNSSQTYGDNYSKYLENNNRKQYVFDNLQLRKLAVNSFLIFSDIIVLYIVVRL